MSERKDIDRAVGNIVQWCKKPKWAEWHHLVSDSYIVPVAEDLHKPPQQIFTDIYERGLDVMYFGLSIETFLSGHFGPKNLNPVDDYLKYKASKETPTGRNYLRALRDAEVCLWEVVKVSPGEWLEVQNIFADKDIIRVFEKSGSESLVKGDHICARVITLGKKHMFTGSILPINRQALGMIKEQLINDAETPLWIHAGHAWLITSLNPQLPEVLNTDGDPLLFSEARLKVTDADALCSKLSQHPDFSQDGDNPPAWSWLSDGSSASVPSQESELVFRSEKEGRICMATLTLPDNHTLTLNTNSKERMEHCISELKSLVGNLITGEPLISYQTTEQLMKEKGKAVTLFG